MSSFMILCFIVTMSIVFISPGTAFRRNAKELDFPTCAAESACGLLQINTLNKLGITRRPLCRCTKSPCPMNWDEKDGFSVTQGSDQYKFCDPAPKLRPCDTTQLAFTGRLQSSRISKTQIRSNRLHCICPARHTYHLISSDLPSSDPENENREWKYVCAPFDKCKAESPCKTIREYASEFLVKKECMCREGHRCPTTTKNATKQPNYWSNESVYNVYCQKKKKSQKIIPKKVCIYIFWQRLQ